jgi:hypothetical protein
MSRLASRLLTAFLVFAVLTAISFLLPRSLPGEIGGASLSAHQGAPCAKCPPTEQLTGVGLRESDGWFVTVRFAAPPVNTRVTLEFEGVRGAIELQQAGKEWRQVASRGAKASAEIASVAQRSDVVTFGLPATLRATGVAVTTGSGDRVPASGFAPSVYPEAAHFNATDVVLLVALVATAVYGFKRGAIAEVGDLVSILLSIVVSAIAYRPLAAMFTQAGNPQAAAAIGSGVLVLVTAAAGFAFIPQLIARLGVATKPLAPAVNGAMGSITACLRQLALLSMALRVGLDVALLHWAAPSITSSVLGTALLNAWKTIFAV